MPAGLATLEFAHMLDPEMFASLTQGDEILRDGLSEARAQVSSLLCFFGFATCAFKCCTQSFLCDTVSVCVCGHMPSICVILGALFFHA